MIIIIIYGMNDIIGCKFTINMAINCNIYNISVFNVIWIH